MRTGLGHLLLRVANVNPRSVTTHSDRVLYRSIGVFILLYAVYATLGGAAFIDAGSGYRHPWFQWLVGPLVAIGVVAYDRAVVGRVPISFDQLDSTDPEHLLRRPHLGLYLGRIALALLFALLVTEPLMLARYRGEIDARLAETHSAQLGRLDAGGAVADYRARLTELRSDTENDDAAVRALADRAAGKRRDARDTYRQALADSAGSGVTHSPGCPRKGFCDHLVHRSRSLDEQAAALDRQAAGLQRDQRPERAARAAEQSRLTALLDAERTANADAVRGDAGFGARTAAMWHLVRADFWGVGVYYLGIALLMVALDCAAIGLKFASRGNAYERNEARAGRLWEHEAALIFEREVHDARTYGDATAKVIADGIEAASRDVEIAQAATRRARAVLHSAVIVDPSDIEHFRPRADA
ncbi:hypothetical protein ACWT_7512 [Actinoplanes sp. SE50]|uniref:DUF4407 domain-containing protein n=1 Tax=unclassified Actinoplanes TaxID=2626549 RepID=UPI00023EDCD1|nr:MULTISPECIES: DUF4407 domain-containing protein [unclassified Actinoplanes]AEV88522.1 hypothetical protein ACPL_7642 [Actinoplanes sp. SE50/110]ATO86927.1 hypothetical protein ACWT_7512 [Actinoplanes sp. SE50]SLM04345.1 hypothetical protein ACSP50_7650 [Actinoplanes sp. SE50/110]